jgi:hypothetical protein
MILEPEMMMPAIAIQAMQGITARIANTMPMSMA